MELFKCRIIIYTGKGSVACSSEDVTGVLECSLSLKPSYTTRVPRKGPRFFLEMARAVSFDTVCAAGCSVALSQQHSSELTFAGYRPTGPLVSEEKINHLLQKHPSVLNSPIDRWLPVSGNI